MFYAHFVLAKKGPLARIWLAAHWDKKLTKAQVFETNIEKSVEGILQPKVKMALRTTGHLLLGVVRIYSRKAKYLLADCNEAFVKIKMAFRPGMVDLPEENREAAVNAITLPEVFHDFDSAMPDLNDVDIQAQFTLNQSRAEEITMREELFYSNPNAGDDGFGDMGFGPEPIELARDTSISNSLSTIDHVKSSEVFEQEKSTIHNVTGASLSEPLRDDGFGGNLGQDIMAGGLFEGDIFEDAPLPEFGPMSVPASEHPADDITKDKKLLPGEKLAESDDDDVMDHFGGPSSVGGASSISGGSRPASPHLPDNSHLAVEAQSRDLDHQLAGAMQAANNAHDQTTLIHNEDESFALAPIEASALKGWPRAKRKRKLIVDEIKGISGEEMKAQLSDTSDIITTLDLAPPTKRLMHWKETGGVEKLFALPGRTISSKSVSRIYQRHMTSRSAENEVFDLNDDAAHEQMMLEQVKEVPEEPLPAQESSRKSRKRKHEEEQELLPPEIPMQPTPGLELEQNAAVTQVLDALENTIPINSIPELPVAQASPQVEAPNPQLEQQPLPILPEHDQIPIQPFPEHPQAELPHQMQAIPPQIIDSQIEMENMGYQHDHPQMTNMGYEPVMQQQDLRPHLQPQTPDVRDYEFPASVGPPEEQQQLDDETYEQFEERVLNKRAGHMHHIIQSRFETQDTLRFSEMILGNNRKQVAQKFYTLLVLKKQQAIELEQTNSYDELYITKGNKFETCVL